MTEAQQLILVLSDSNVRIAWMLIVSVSIINHLILKISLRNPGFPLETLQRISSKNNLARVDFDLNNWKRV